MLYIHEEWRKNLECLSLLSLLPHIQFNHNKIVELSSMVPTHQQADDIHFKGIRLLRSTEEGVLL